MGFYSDNSVHDANVKAAQSAYQTAIAGATTQAPPTSCGCVRSSPVRRPTTAASSRSWPRSRVITA
jgi:hypothetical protein